MTTQASSASPLDITVMHLAAMEAGKRYVVTKASDDGTFEIGDHITLHTDGTIGCREAAGWIEQPDAEGAIKGCELAIDQEWVERRKQKLMQELASLNT